MADAWGGARTCMLLYSYKFQLARYATTSVASPTVKALEMLRPFISVLPEVAKPERKVHQHLRGDLLNLRCSVFSQ